MGRTRSNVSSGPRLGTPVPLLPRLVDPSSTVADTLGLPNSCRRYEVFGFSHFDARDASGSFKPHRPASTVLHDAFPTEAKVHGRPDPPLPGSPSAHPSYPPRRKGEGFASHVRRGPRPSKASGVGDPGARGRRTPRTRTEVLRPPNPLLDLVGKGEGWRARPVGT